VLVLVLVLVLLVLMLLMLVLVLVLVLLQLLLTAKAHVKHYAWEYGGVASPFTQVRRLVVVDDIRIPVLWNS